MVVTDSPFIHPLIDHRASDLMATTQTGFDNAANRDDHAAAHTTRTRQPISTGSAL